MKHSTILRLAKSKLSYGYASAPTPTGPTLICVAIDSVVRWPWDKRKAKQLKAWITSMLYPYNTLELWTHKNNNDDLSTLNHINMQTARHYWLIKMIEYLEAQGK
jgi:hypothetical protein